MELTREQLEKIVKEVNLVIYGIFEIEQVKQLARQLIQEMDKSKVWDGAPEWATGANVFYCDGMLKTSVSKTYTRTLPKSPEREIAENIADKKWLSESLAMNKKDFADALESAINEYKESVK